MERDYRARALAEEGRPFLPVRRGDGAVEAAWAIIATTRPSPSGDGGWSQRQFEVLYLDLVAVSASERLRMPYPSIVTGHLLALMAPPPQALHQAV